jgi:hypothetical protein
MGGGIDVEPAGPLELGRGRARVDRASDDVIQVVLGAHMPLPVREPGVELHGLDVGAGGVGRHELSLTGEQPAAPLAQLEHAHLGRQPPGGLLRALSLSPRDERQGVAVEVG